MRTEEQLRELLGTYKMSMVDYEPDVSIQEEIFLSLTYDCFQLKEDGWFTLVDFDEGLMRVMTSGGDIRISEPVPYEGSSLFMCEWMFGTNWSQRSSRKGHFMVFDSIFVDGADCTFHSIPMRNAYAEDFIRRYGVLLGDRFIPVRTWPLSQLSTVWFQRVMVEDGYEGIVLKKSTEPLFPGMHLGRMKKVVDCDYIVIGFTEGKGRLMGTLGAIVGGLFVNGVITKVCTVGGGFSDEDRDKIWSSRYDILGKVMKVEGKMRFSSGALRHPAFVCFRDDKKAEECILHKEW